MKGSEKMKKQLIFIGILLICSFIYIGNVNALYIGRNTYDQKITLKTGPGNNYSNSGSLSYNDTFIMNNTNKIKSTSGCSSGWYRINYWGYSRYVCSSYVTTSTITAQTNAKSLAIKNGASSGYATYKTVGNNKQLTLVSSTKYKGNGCSKGWYKVNYNSSQKYVCSNYMDTYNSSSDAIVTNVNGAKIYKSASSKSKQITKLNYGYGLTLNSTTKYKGSGCSSGWYKISYRNSSAYICSISVQQSTNKNVYLVNHTSGVGVRKSAKSSAKIVAKLKYNTPVMLQTTTKYKGAGCGSGWYKIKISGTSGYVCSTMLTNTSNTTVMTVTAGARKSADANSTTVKTINKGQVAILQSTTKYKGAGCGSGWYKISINKQTAYICSKNTEIGIGTPAPTNTTTSTTTGNITKIKTSSGYYYTTNKWEYRLKENYGNVRSSASTSSALKNTVYLGTEFKVLGTAKASSGCSSGWYKVSYYNNRTGYICKSLVDKYSDITNSNSAYCNTLIKQGFPQSYCPYLTYLHNKYPNWVFKPEKTGIAFLTAINGESEKNYTQLSESPYLASTTIREKPNWRTASDGYVAYMLDPRNYLNEQNIFAFETLSYDSNYHTKSAVRSIVSGTYLDTDTYANYFINAAKKYKVSPVHLASRVKQEGGTNPSYDSVSGKSTSTCTVTSYVCSTYTKLSSKTAGKLTDSVNLRTGAGTNYSVQTLGRSGETFTLSSTSKYKGTGCNDGWYKIKLTRSLKNIYNYYNIGAYGSNPVLRGLQAAAGCVDTNEGTPWDTREKAIVYGASFIANGYITKGQDTMYYQKFNTSPNAYYSKYTHQYMTNILAPAGESLSTYESYSNLKIINKGYVFKIPVYTNMPTNHTTHPQF